MSFFTSFFKQKMYILMFFLIFFSIYQILMFFHLKLEKRKIKIVKMYLFYKKNLCKKTILFLKMDSKAKFFSKRKENMQKVFNFLENFINSIRLSKTAHLLQYSRGKNCCCILMRNYHCNRFASSSITIIIFLVD